MLRGFLPCGLLVSLALASPAWGGTAEISGTAVRYTGGAERNAVTVTQRDATTFRITDSRTAVTPGAGCRAVNGNTADCQAAGVARIVVRLAAGADSAVVTSGLRASLIGGLGNDRLQGGAGPDLLGGEAGNDDLRGGAASDRLEGAAGRDRLAGGDGDDIELGGGDRDTFIQGPAPSGGDLISGGRGVDLVSYDQRTAPVDVTLDARANDGDRAGAEGDDVRVEDVLGGAAGDRVVGDDRANRIFGQGGDDVLRGGTGGDWLAGGPGIDSLVSRDRSRDLVTCEGGRDSVAADRRDVVVATCERVRRTLSMRLRRPREGLSRSGRLGIAVSCPDTAFGQCVGKVALVTARRIRTRSGVRRVRLGARRFRLDPGETRTINVRLRRSALRLLRRERTLSVRAQLEGARDAAGPSRRVARRFRLRAP